MEWVGSTVASNNRLEIIFYKHHFREEQLWKVLEWPNEKEFLKSSKDVKKQHNKNVRSRKKIIGNNILIFFESNDGENNNKK